MTRFTPALARLDDRDCPSIALYNPDGSVRGELLHPDPALYTREPELFYQPGVNVTVGSPFGWRVYLEGAPAGAVVREAAKYDAVRDVVQVTNQDPGPAVPHTTVHFGVDLSFIKQVTGNPSAVAAGQLGGTEAWVSYEPAHPLAAPAAEHETGHTFGLAHTPDVPDRIMFASLVSSDASYFSPDELAQVRHNAQNKLDGLFGSGEIVE